ncbi:agmatine deiminase [Saccharospirillum mangrovi]|uniref:agmatine deiminase n=1 Tax=Saccharospirillum mangrovi TaxID=2161747 RepID=UPI0022B7F6CF|nr:agmatine deiminase [Saccharospirillum mangrovi]
MPFPLASTPRADGFFMPPEWHPHRQTWMLWPERPDNWRYGAKPAQRAYTAVAEAIARFEPVTMGVSADQYENACARLSEKIRVVEISSNDAWVRDTGPTFVIDGKGNQRANDWEFNAWGGLTGGLYQPWNRDDQVAQKICNMERIERYRTDGFVLEGGAIHVDGEGTLLTTEECLLNANRNPHLSRAEIEQKLRDHLGIDTVLWLPEGVYNDETNGHIDNIACFIEPGHIVLAWTDDESDPQYQRSRTALEYLENQRDAQGRKLKVTKLPMPQPLIQTDDEADGIDQAAKAWPRRAGERMAASYVNFLIVNGGIILPAFGDAMDERAANILADLCPGREIVPVASREILLGGGNIHCITQQQPLA